MFFFFVLRRNWLYEKNRCPYFSSGHGKTSTENWSKNAQVYYFYGMKRNSAKIVPFIVLFRVQEIVEKKKMKPIAVGISSSGLDTIGKDHRPKVG